MKIENNVNKIAETITKLQVLIVALQVLEQIILKNLVLLGLVTRTIILKKVGSKLII